MPNPRRFRCPECGSHDLASHIPEDVKRRAQKAGMRKIDWYAGRLDCPVRSAALDPEHS